MSLSLGACWPAWAQSSVVKQAELLYILATILSEFLMWAGLLLQYDQPCNNR
jgi:hypothetical protein